MKKMNSIKSENESQRSENEFFPDPFFSPYHASGSHIGRNYAEMKTEENKRNDLKIEENKS